MKSQLHLQRMDYVWFSKLAIGSGVMFEMGVRMTTVWSVSLVRSIGLGMSKFRSGTLGYRNRIVADACTIVWQRGLGELRLTTRNLLTGLQTAKQTCQSTGIQ